MLSWHDQVEISKGMSLNLTQFNSDNLVFAGFSSVNTKDSANSKYTKKKYCDKDTFLLQVPYHGHVSV